jgi:hypothetical protein
MNTQSPASSEIRASLPWCGQCEGERPPTVTITRSDGSEAAAFCLRCSPQLLSSLVKPLQRGEVIVQLMSVSLTEQQVRDRRKTVTGLGWPDLCAGEQPMLCHKVMGLRLGVRIVRMTPVEVVSVWREPLSVITAENVAAEGFPDWTPAELVEFLCRTHAGSNRDTEVTRVEWRDLDGAPESDRTGEKDLHERGRPTGGMQWPS